MKEKSSFNIKFTGIAAGLVQQNVAIRELLLLTRHHARSNNRQQVQLTIDNRFAVSLFVLLYYVFFVLFLITI